MLSDWTSWALWRQSLSITPDKLLVSFNSHLGLKRFHRRLNVSLLLWSCSQSSFRAIFVASLLLWFSAAALPISLPHTHNHTWIMQALRELHLGDKNTFFFFSRHNAAQHLQIKVELCGFKKNKSGSQKNAVAAWGNVSHWSLFLIYLCCYRDERLSWRDYGWGTCPRLPRVGRPVHGARLRLSEHTP